MNEQNSTQCPTEEDKVFPFTSAFPVSSIVFVVVLRVSARQWKLALVQLHLKSDHEGIWPEVQSCTT